MKVSELVTMLLEMDQNSEAVIDYDNNGYWEIEDVESVADNVVSITSSMDF